MDGRQFDTVTRSLVDTATRRALLGGLFAGVATATVSRLGWAPDAAARCTKLNQRCQRGDTCCGGAKCRGRRCRCTGSRRPCRGRCIRPAQCCTNADCNGGICRNSTCRLAPNQGTCTAEFNACTFDPTPDCGTNCTCYVTRQGLSFCGRKQVTCGCGANLDCAHIPGAVCVEQRGGCCTLSGNTTCVLPCQDPD